MTRDVVSLCDVISRLDSVRFAFYRPILDGSVEEGLICESIRNFKIERALG